MAITPNTTFVAGNVLTAAQQNAFPFGILGKGTGAIQSTTGAGFETFITTTATVLANRSIQIIAQVQPYGYAGGFNMRIQEGGSTIFSSFSAGLSATDAQPYQYTFVYTPASAGSKTYTLQMQRVGATNLAQYVDTTILAQMIVSDIGTA